MPIPNRYGELAQTHMRTFLPARYAAISDPERYFSDLGEDISDQVAEIERTLAGDEPPGEEWMDRVGRLNMARLMAEERVLAEMAFLRPETNQQVTGDHRR